MSDDTVYLDFAATTPVDARVIEAMLPYFGELFGNPSSVYTQARTARQAVDRARGTVASLLGAMASEVIFTSGGTESDNAAIKGAIWANRERGNHVVTTQIEHHAVIHTCEWLQRFGVETTYVPVESDGIVDPAAIAKAMRPTTVLVSTMHANNEIGTLQPLAEIAEIAHAHGALLHTDAVQTAGQLPLDVSALGVDMLSLSAHKFYGPKGIGVLFVRRGCPWLPTQQGGGQERGRRAGTENVASVVGLATALALARDSMSREAERSRLLRDRLITGILSRVPGSVVNGHRERRLPNNANFTFIGVDGESMLLNLDMQGVAASSGSACTAGSIDPSHVLLALGMPRDLAASALRLSLGRSTTDAHIDRVLDILPAVVARLRAINRKQSVARAERTGAPESA